MNKKQIAYILIGAGVLAAIYYLYTKSKGAAAAAALGAGMADNRGAWAAEDDALYAKFRSNFSANDLNWLDPLVDQAYTTSLINGTVPCKNDVKIKGVAMKSGSFACVVYGVAPNPSGTYPALPWGAGQPSLWPPSLITSIFNDLNVLRTKYEGL